MIVQKKTGPKIGGKLLNINELYLFTLTKNGQIAAVGAKTISRGVYAASYLSFFGIGLTLILPFSAVSLRSQPKHYPERGRLGDRAPLSK